MSELVDAEPCDVLRGGDGPVYFLLGGRLYVVHEVLGRWIEADGGRRPRSSGSGSSPADGGAAQQDREQEQESASGQVEHWLVVASVGRFGTPGVFRLQRRPAPPADGPDTWSVRAERR